jgi:hypothetical protein
VAKACPTCMRALPFQCSSCAAVIADFIDIASDDAACVAFSYNSL